MKIKFIQNVIDKLRGKECNQTPPKIYWHKNKHVEQVYNTYYATINTVADYPDFYNKDGKKMEMWFIRDLHVCHSPYGYKSRYFVWDRFNIGLNTHFYSHQSMLETMGSPKKRYGFLIESPSIVPEDYTLFKTHKGL